MVPSALMVRVKVSRSTSVCPLALIVASYVDVKHGSVEVAVLVEEDLEGAVFGLGEVDGEGAGRAGWVDAFLGEAEGAPLGRHRCGRSRGQEQAEDENDRQEDDSPHDGPPLGWEADKPRQLAVWTTEGETIGSSADLERPDGLRLTILAAAVRRRTPWVCRAGAR
jgi:hypothetical protein